MESAQPLWELEASEGREAVPWAVGTLVPLAPVSPGLLPGDSGLVLRQPLQATCRMLPWARAPAMYLCTHCLWCLPVHLCASGQDGSGGPRSPNRGGTPTLASHPTASPKALCPPPLATLFCTPHLTGVAEGEGAPASGTGGALITARPFPYPTQGRFTIAAKHHISIAEIYETELVDIEKVSGNQALPGRSRQGGLQRPVLQDWGSSLCPVHSGESSGV